MPLGFYSVTSETYLGIQMENSDLVMGLDNGLVMGKYIKSLHQHCIF